MTMLLLLISICFVVATLSASAVRSIAEMTWHELEELCQQRQRPELFGKIFDARDEIEFGVGILKMVTIAVGATAATVALLYTHDAQTLTSMHFCYIATLIAFACVVAGSWIPWAVARIGAPQYLYYTWRWWWAVSFFAWPLLVGGNFVVAIFERASGQEEDDEDEEESFEDEILSIVNEAENEGALEENRANMIEGVIDLDDADVTKVMTPRSKVDLMEISTDWDEMLAQVVESERTRIPVYEDKIDNVIGILYAKDLLKESLRSESKRRTLRKLLRKPLFVADSQLLDEMLKQFLAGRMHMAIVHDEYGGLAGVVTIEDVLEEIVGEIQDEKDEMEPQEIKMLGPGEAEVEGSTAIDAINEKMGLTLPDEEEFGTVGGLIMSHLKDIPRPGHEITFDNVTIEIVEANRRSIRLVRVKLNDEAA